MKYLKKAKKNIFALAVLFLGQSFLNVQLIALTDQDVASQLIANVQNMKEKGLAFSQSQAHMSIPSVQSSIKKIPGLAENKSIIDGALKNEEKYKDDYYVFYTAIPGMRVLQDITRKLYVEKFGIVGALQEDAFQFIRYVYNDSVYDLYKNAQDFLLKEMEQSGIVNDNDSRIKSILLSVNLAILGNAGLDVESTYHYFNEPQSWVTDELREILLKKSIKSFGYSIDFINDLLQLQSSTKNEFADLFQIFIPKDKVNIAGYDSWRQGIPFTTDLIEYILGESSVDFSKKGGVFGPTITSKIEQFQKKLKSGNPQAKKFYDQMLQDVRDGKFNLSTFLDQYKADPSSIKDLDFHQGRLVITRDLLLNPESGIRIYRFSKLSPQQEQEYKSKLDSIVKKIIVTKPTVQGGTKTGELLENIKTIIEDARSAGKPISPVTQQIFDLINQES